MIFREMPFNDTDNKIEISEQLQEMINLCLEPNPHERAAPRTLLGKLTSWKIVSNPDFNVNQSENASSIEAIKSSTSYCVNSALEINDRVPDLFFLNKILLSAWNKPETIGKFYNLVSDADKKLTVVAVKSLIVLHRYLISGPIEVLNSNAKSLIESILQFWTHKEKDPVDQYHCDYFCGLIRQMCRVLLDKLEIHGRTSSVGN